MGVVVGGSCGVWGLRLVGIKVFRCCFVWEKQRVVVAASGGQSV